jgi:signal transduction histidine kinase
VFCFAADGTTLAHGGNPALVGKNLINVRNPDGKLGNAEIIHTGLEQGAGWVDVRWQNPVSKKIEAKSVYVIRLDANSVCASGYYKG